MKKPSLQVRYILYRVVALAALVFISPLVLILYILVRIDSSGSFIFKQRRLGKDKKPFTLYKIRTMIVGAEKQRGRLLRYNEATGPVFKIRQDPRFTTVGKILSHSALDEILQLINVMRGEMSFVGPRPLPVSEARKIPKKYERRFSVLPGMTSEWIICGAHRISFTQWMKTDMAYADNPTFSKDMKILALTLLSIPRAFIQSLIGS